MIRLGSVAASLALAAAMLFVIAPPALAHEVPCVSRAEFKKVDEGMSKTRVHTIFDFNGSQVIFASPPPVQERQYRTCTHSAGWHGKAFVDYEKQDGTWRVVSRFVFW
jgi:hypothetical protein